MGRKANEERELDRTAGLIGLDEMQWFLDWECDIVNMVSRFFLVGDGPGQCISRSICLTCSVFLVYEYSRLVQHDESMLLGLS